MGPFPLEGPTVAASDGDPFEVLSSLLAAASRLAHELGSDPLVERLLRAFTAMPEGDREIVIGVIEREVQTRRLSQKVADTLTQVELRPNPNARLYFRVIAPEQESQIDMVAFLRAAYTIQRGIDVLDHHWRDLVMQTLRNLDPAARQKIGTFNDAIRETLDECARQEEPAEAHDPPVSEGMRSRRG
jgi:hypothetical protein